MAIRRLGCFAFEMQMPAGPTALTDMASDVIQKIKAGMKPGQKLKDVVIEGVGRVDLANELKKEMAAELSVDGEITTSFGSILYTALAQWGEVLISYWVE